MSTEADELVKCPHCAELIQPDAKVCKHCGRDVDPRVLRANAFGQLGKSMQSIGCLMTLFITVPICICMLFYYLGSG